MNIQFVLCPGINDGKELEYSLTEIAKYGECITSAAVVPVGLTDHRDDLADVRPYDKQGARDVIELCDKFNSEHFEQFGRNFVYVADEFFLKAEMKIPPAEYYDDFPQLSNGVGMMALMKKEFMEASDELDTQIKKKVMLITGFAAKELLCDCASYIMKKQFELVVDVLSIRNDYFGEKITVAGLITGTDIAAQAGDLSEYDTVVIPSVMLKSDDEQIFLDDMTLSQLEEKINKKITVSDGSGEGLLRCIVGESE